MRRIAYNTIFLAIIVIIALIQLRICDKFAVLSNTLDKLSNNFANAELTVENCDFSVKNSQNIQNANQLFWAIKSEPRTLFPLNSDVDIYKQRVVFLNIFEPLLKYDFDSLELKPLLAKSYHISADSSEIVFNINENAYFSDGIPVSADDVIFTYNWIVNNQNDSASLTQLYDNVEIAVKVDQKTVLFKLKSYNFKSLERLSFWGVGILPKHIYGKAGQASQDNSINPVGSGPYVFEKWDSGQQIVLEKNENYWDEKPRVDRIVYKFINNDNASLQALKAGEIDIFRPSAEQFHKLSRDSEFRENFNLLRYQTPSAPFYFIGWNLKSELFTDEETRIALAYLVDKNSIAENLLKGEAKVISTPFDMRAEHSGNEAKSIVYNPEKGLELLKKAGWADENGDGVLERDGVDFRFGFKYASSSTVYQRLAKFLKSSLEKAGIVLEPEPLEWSVFIDEVSRGEFEAFIMGQSFGVCADPYDIFHSSQITSNNGANYVGFEYLLADNVIERIRNSTRKGECAGLYSELGEILVEKQPMLFLYTMPSFRVVNKKIKNVKVHVLGLNCHEWYIRQGDNNIFSD